MFRHKRPALGVLMAMAIALVVAAPVAATTPTRIVDELHPFVLRAGSFCAFAVAGQPEWGFSATTVLPDGRTQYSVRAHGAYINMETGATDPTADNYRETDRVDQATGNLVGSTSGETTFYLHPGDIGPFGVVTTSSGGLYHIVGTASYTLDADYRTLAFSYSGTVENICAALS
jgi:hypothetical protein